MTRTALYLSYFVLSLILFIWIFFAWFTGSFGDLFANELEAAHMIVRLLLVGIPPWLLRYFKKTASPTRSQTLTLALLLFAEFLMLSYYAIWQLNRINAATVLIGIVSALLLAQLIQLSVTLMGSK